MHTPRSDAYRPYRPDYDGTFSTEDDAQDEIRISLRRVDGKWRVLATEPGHAEHLHQDAFTSIDEAKGFRDAIRRGLATGRQLNLNHWDTRAL